MLDMLSPLLGVIADDHVIHMSNHPTSGWTIGAQRGTR
jgi:hypothetical protein